MEPISFETADQDEALDFVQRVYDTRFRSVRTEDPFLLSHARTDYGEWTTDAVHLQSGGYTAEPYGVLSICRVYSGRLALTTGRDTLSLQTGDVAVMADAARPFQAHWDRADATMVRIPVATLERVAQQGGIIPEGSRFVLLSRRPVAAEAARHWVQVMAFAQRQVSGANPAAVTRHAVAHLVAATALTTFPNTLVPESSAHRRPADVPATVAMAVDFITRTADLGVTVADAAAYTAVSPRALQLAFRKHLGTSPAAYLRSYRLARVHDELLAASPGDGSSVTRIAARWKFTDSSRFATHYKAVYQELPSQTLRAPAPDG